MSFCDIWLCFTLFCHLTACREGFFWSALFNDHTASVQNCNMKADNDRFVRERCCLLWFCCYQMRYEMKDSDTTDNTVKFFLCDN